ncbi:MAG TPA: HD domain-containing phosphohydrolase [bacterium]|nr:HD domain-containing phosphohydrolase [bacterium]
MVIEQVNQALVCLQRALSARSLYSHLHPAVEGAEQEAWEQLTSLLQDRNEVRVTFFDGRVVWEDQRLPSGRQLGEELWPALRRCGVDQVGFRHGLEIREVHTLMNVLAGAEPWFNLDECTGFAFGHIVETTGDDPLEELGAQVDLVRELHLAVSEDGSLDLEKLDQVLISIAGVVARHAGALIPLLEIKKHDEYTFIHTTNVGILSGALAEVVGLGAPTAREIMLAALLHDVGKQAVPEELLNKKGKLSDEEMAVLRRHPVDGARLLYDTPGAPDLAIIVAYEHHIQVGGGGYPATPPGWRLSLASQIVQMADVYDAMRTNRPYRAAIPPAKIREIMRNLVGEMFDADLLTLFFREVTGRPPEPAAAEAEEQS